MVLWFVVLPLIAMSQVPVVLVAGQSNTDGRVDNVELPAYIKRDGFRVKDILKPSPLATTARSQSDGLTMPWSIMSWSVCGSGLSM